MGMSVRDYEANLAPLVSIVTVTYRDLDGALGTINSVQSQTGIDFQSVEHIVVDGGTDGFPRDVAGRVKVIVVSEADNGLYDAMNKGVKLATGAYVMFLNGGDTLYSPSVLEKISASLALLNANEFLFGRASLEGEGVVGARLYPSDRYSIANVGEFLSKALPCHQAMLVPRWFCLEQTYDTRYRISADAKFKRVALKRLVPIFLDLPIVSFDLSGISSSTNTLGVLRARIKESTMTYSDGLCSTRELFVSYIFHLMKYFSAKFRAKRFFTILRKFVRD